MNRTLGIVALGCILLCTAALGSGGIYMDSVLLTNNGSPVFSDSFDKATLDGWKADGTTFVQTQAKPPQYCLYLTRPTRGRCQAQHFLSLDNVGTLELSAWVYLPPVEQQATYNDNRCNYAGFCVYAADPKDHISATLFMQPKGTGYRADAVWYDQQKNSNVRSYTDKPVLSGGKWARATMRFDPDERTVTLLIDGAMACRITYDPSRFKSIGSIMLYSDLWG